MLIAVNFHYIREKFDAPYPSIFGLTPEEFSQQLDILGKNAQFLSGNDICKIINEKKHMPKRGVVITFDDGLKEQYNLAWRILKEKEIPGIFFINTRPIEESVVTTVHKIHIIRAFTPPKIFQEILNQTFRNIGKTVVLPNPKISKDAYKYDPEDVARLKYLLNYLLDEQSKKIVIDSCFKLLGFDESGICHNLYMNKKMVTDLAKSDAIGTHGHEHLPLGLLDPVAALQDIQTSIHFLKKWTGKSITSLSYPYGNRDACSSIVADYAKRNNVQFGFTMERAGNAIIDKPMFMSRFSSSDVPGGNTCPQSEDLFWKNLMHATWFR